MTSTSGGRPRWTLGGRSRPRLISDDDIEFIVAAATTRLAKLRCPFTHWSIRKPAGYLGGNSVRQVRIGRERLRQILHERGISFQRTRTWKEFGPLRTFVMGNSNHQSHPTLARRLQAYLRRRNANARHPDALARPTPRTRPHPQPTTTTLGPTTTQSRMIKPDKRSWSTH